VDTFQHICRHVFINLQSMRGWCSYDCVVFVLAPKNTWKSTKIMCFVVFVQWVCCCVLLCVALGPALCVVVFQLMPWCLLCFAIDTSCFVACCCWIECLTHAPLLYYIARMHTVVVPCMCVGFFKKAQGNQFKNVDSCHTTSQGGAMLTLNAIMRRHEFRKNNKSKHATNSTRSERFSRWIIGLLEMMATNPMLCY
jgi:hypothetical protein